MYVARMLCGDQRFDFAVNQYQLMLTQFPHNCTRYTREKLHCMKLLEQVVYDLLIVADVVTDVANDTLVSSVEDCFKEEIRTSEAKHGDIWSRFFRLTSGAAYRVQPEHDL